jgi:hypothetical protein
MKMKSMSMTSGDEREVAVDNALPTPFIPRSELVVFGLMCLCVPILNDIG